MERYEDMSKEKAGLEMALDEMTKQKAEIETLKHNCEEEINKLKVVIDDKPFLCRLLRCCCVGLLSIVPLNPRLNPISHPNLSETLSIGGQFKTLCCRFLLKVRTT